MGQTDEFDLRWPELGDLADGPDGFADLAADTEAALKGLRDTADDIAYTPTWSAAGAQPSGGTWAGRYQVRSGWCQLALFGGFTSSVNGGAGALGISLPVRSRASFNEQSLYCKLYMPGVGNFWGYCYVPPNTITAFPNFARSLTNNIDEQWRSALAVGAGNGGPGTGVPAVDGQYSVQPGGNLLINGRYLV